MTPAHFTYTTPSNIELSRSCEQGGKVGEVVGAKILAQEGKVCEENLSFRHGLLVDVGYSIKLAIFIRSECIDKNSLYIILYL